MVNELSFLKVDVVHDLEQKNCADYHEKLTLIGKKCVYREVGLKQPELFCRNHYQQTYECENCHPKGGDKIVAGKVPTSPIFPHSYFSSSVLAQVVTSKYLMAVPLNRQAIYFKHIGLPIDTKHMARAIIKLSEQLETIYNELTKILLKNLVIHMDETPFQVLEEKNRSKSYFWVMRTTEEFSNYQIVVFNYSSGRK